MNARTTTLFYEKREIGNDQLVMVRLMDWNNIVHQHYTLERHMMIDGKSDYSIDALTGNMSDVVRYAVKTFDELFESHPMREELK